MKRNAYVIVFGIVAIVVIAAAVSTLFTPQGSGQAIGNPSALPNYGKAPDFQGIAAWINSPPLDISQLHGRVILVDFWTYSCINCIRTVPYLNAWYNEYGGSNGLVIVGVHTPEFTFEKNYSNVVTAVNNFGIKYPVALDSNYGTWNAYGNQYWPADYVIDANGTIRYKQLGEGDYNGTEAVIRELLQSAHYSVPSGTAYSTVSGTNVDFSQIGTPELYVGYATARQPIGNAQGFSPGQVVDYTIQGGLQRNYVYFTGDWYNANDSMIAAGKNAKVFLLYDAKVVNIVAQGNNTLIAVSLDGNTPSGAFLGKDLSPTGGSASAYVGMARLYNIVNGPSYGEHEVVITVSPGFRLYTFTFG